MDAARYRDSPVGHLVAIRGTDGRTGREYDHVAFVPEPLGPTPKLSGRTWRAVARAGYALGRLQAGRQVSSTLLHRPTLRREAQSTSALEGTFAPLEEVLAADLIDEGNRSTELQEVLNYIETAETAFGWLASGRHLTPGLYVDLHKHLVRGTRADTEDAGRIRTILVAIGPGGDSLEEARFVPPPPGLDLDAAVRDLFDWIKADDTEADPVVKAAMTHYQFETLHPFNDGNGRLGRLLVVLQLMQSDQLSGPLLTVSPWLEARRGEYHDRLSAVSADGDWDGWVGFLASGLEASALDTTTRVDQLLALLEGYRRRLRSADAKGIIRDIAEDLVASPYVTVQGIAQRTGRSFQAASNAVNRLVELDILRERTGKSYSRIFVAHEVVAVLVRP